LIFAVLRTHQKSEFKNVIVDGNSVTEIGSADVECDFSDQLQSSSEKFEVYTIAVDESADE